MRIVAFWQGVPEPEKHAHKNPVDILSENDHGYIFVELPDQDSSLWSAGQKLQIE